MTKRLLILFSVLLIVIAMAVPAFASTADSLVGSTWVVREDPTIEPLDYMITDTYNVNFTSGSKSFTSMSFEKGSNHNSLKFDDITIYSYYRSPYSVATNNLSEYPEIKITGGEDISDSDFLKDLRLFFEMSVPPIYEAVPDSATGYFDGYLTIIGSILTSLFTPSGDLFPLGSVIAVCFVVAVIYGGVRLFRKVTPGT